MAEETKIDHRPWWALSRWQGILVTAGGVAMLFNPVTHPYAGDVIKTGLLWFASGAVSAASRKGFNSKVP